MAAPASNKLLVLCVGVFVYTIFFGVLFLLSSLLFQIGLPSVCALIGRTPPSQVFLVVLSIISTHITQIAVMSHMFLDSYDLYQSVHKL